jgi:hypothetical protein
MEAAHDGEYVLAEDALALQAERAVNAAHIKDLSECLAQCDKQIDKDAKRIESLQAEEERLLRLLRANVDSEIWEWAITGVEVDAEGEPTEKDDE